MPRERITEADRERQRAIWIPILLKLETLMGRVRKNPAGIVHDALVELGLRAEQVGKMLPLSWQSDAHFEQMVASAERAEEKLLGLEKALDHVEANREESERLVGEYELRKQKRAKWPSNQKKRKPKK
jgi:hypothetical protein